VKPLTGRLSCFIAVSWPELEGVILCGRGWGVERLELKQVS